MRLIDADVLLDNIRRDSKKAIDEGDKVGSFWLGYAAGSVIAQPTIQPVATDTNVCDKISRQQAIELIKNYCENGCDIAEDNWCPSCQREQFIKLLKALPTVQPEPQEGHWIEGGIYRDVIECYCSECGQLMTTAATVRMNYCPNCGARMKGAKHETD